MKRNVDPAVELLLLLAFIIKAHFSRYPSLLIFVHEAYMSQGNFDNVCRGLTQDNMPNINLGSG